MSRTFRNRDNLNTQYYCEDTLKILNTDNIDFYMVPSEFKRKLNKQKIRKANAQVRRAIRDMTEENLTLDKMYNDAKYYWW